MDVNIERICQAPKVREIEAGLEKLFEDLRKNGHVRYGLLALANTLQSELTRADCPKDVPHAWAMEYLMRAISADIEGNRDVYVTNKLQNGFKCLMGCYKPNKTFEVIEKAA